MSAEPHISETRHGQILAELAGLGLTLARDLHERALAAETAEDATKLATAFHRISRGVRQSLALEARLGREQQAHELQTAPLREKAREVRVARRQGQVFRAVEPLIWDETEDPEIAGHLVDDLRELLEFEALEEEFLVEPLDRQIDRIRARFDLVGPEPEPETEPESETGPEPAIAGDRAPPPGAGPEDRDPDAFGESGQARAPRAAARRSSA